MSATSVADCGPYRHLINSADDVRLWVDVSESVVAPDLRDDVDDSDERPTAPYDQHAGAPSCAVAADDARLMALICQVVDRDERALGQLYDLTSPRIYGLALRITQRVALAEEVVEDTFWQAWRQAPRYEASRGRPLTWLLAMARSRAIDALRRDGRFAHEELPDAESLESSHAVHESGQGLPPQDLLDASRGADALHAALGALDPRARQLVSLAFFRGMTHEEIAQQELMPLGSVKSQIRRSLRHLRRSLETAEA